MNLTFEQLPKAIGQILESLKRIESQIAQLKQPQADQTQILNIHQVAEILDISVPTIYGLTHKMAIPHYKKGKRLYFLQSEINEWLKTGRRKTYAEIQNEAMNYIINRRKRKCK